MTRHIRNILTSLIGMLAILPLAAQSRIVEDFSPVCDSLSTLIRERSTVAGRPVLKSVMKRGQALDFYFTESLGDYPWYKGDVEWFRKTLKSLFPEEYSRYRVGEIYAKGIGIDNLVTSRLTYEGKPASSRYRSRNPAGRKAVVRNEDGLKFSKGMDGRHIALWQSHGRYYEHKTQRWEWQRPCLFRTVEDMFTQGFVLPYLVPMLENAGAYVMLPRERDIQTNEVIADNDSTWDRSAAMQNGYGLNGPVRLCGDYEESGRWSSAGSGFADLKAVYVDTDNPFTSGTARQAECMASSGKGATARAVWRPDIPQRGEYAVYISYKSLPNSTSCASYKVVHMGGESRFTVNQKIGGGTWIYLGTFEFDKGKSGYVSLENRTPEGYRHSAGSVVTADAVRFGGGMGNIARYTDGNGVETAEVSGMPRSAEGARYWMQWAGVDTLVYYQNGGKDDYKDDFCSRGDWVEWMSRGSDVNPGKAGKGIPFDLSFAFHSDAGVTPDDSIIGTLAIYTYKSEGKTRYPDGESRMTSREYTDLVQAQIVNDLRHEIDSKWSRRQIWDRSYRESRTPSVPAMLLELLSHQNFADMKYGLDPTFRFTVSRAVYKGMLKYLSNRYGCEYTVQPLPVHSMSLTFTESGDARLSWKDRLDPIEPTAVPSGYILQTRMDDGAFDQGRLIDVERSGEWISTVIELEKGHIYSFKVTAYNDGGKSFPSEILSIGIPEVADSTRKNILVVNNFTRTSGPAFIDMDSYAGFDERVDSGVPYIRDITYIGDMYQFRRVLPWTDDDNPGFGASYTDYAGKSVAGNTFDYPFRHGKAIIKAGHPFTSCSSEAFCCDTLLTEGTWSIDLICGKQVTTVTGSGQMKDRFTVFPSEMQAAIKRAVAKGCNILVSGSHIGTDIYDCIYPIRRDSTFRQQSVEFAEKTLGFRWMTNFASRKASVRTVPNPVAMPSSPMTYEYHNRPDSRCYSVETPDGLIPAGTAGHTIMRYADTNISAGTAYQGEGYRTVCLGFPIEAVCDEDDIYSIIRLALEYFIK